MAAVEPKAVLADLYNRGVRSVLVEGAAKSMRVSLPPVSTIR